MNKKFIQFGVFSHYLSIDEQMVPYFGRHYCKMFIRMKPIRFGFKFWCLCFAEGYLFMFIPYQGKEPTSTTSTTQTDIKKYLGLGEQSSHHC